MRKSIVLFALLPLAFACNNQPSAPESHDAPLEVVQDTINEDKPSRKSLSVYFTEDKSGDGSWIQAKNALSADQTGIYVYFRTEYDIAKNLRMRMQYGDNTNYKFVVDGKTYTYKANRSKKPNLPIEADINWYDANVKSSDLKFLEALSKSKEARIVLSDGTSQTIIDQTKTNIKRTLDYFEALDGLLPKSNMVNIRRL